MNFAKVCISSFAELPAYRGKEMETGHYYQAMILGHEDLSPGKFCSFSGRSYRSILAKMGTPECIAKSSHWGGKAKISAANPNSFFGYRKDPR